MTPADYARVLLVPALGWLIMTATIWAALVLGIVGAYRLCPGVAP